MIAIATAEFKMLLRNRLVAACAILVPVVFAAVLIATRENFGGTAIVAALLATVIAALGVYITATTVLASRRQNLFLKRLRSTTASNPTILSGLLIPVIAVNLVQLTIILTVIAVLGEPPANPLMVVLAVLIVETMFVGFALATAGLTSSPEHAQVTTMPLFLVSFGAAFWVAFTGTEDLAFVKRLLPGGASTELLIEAWSGVGAGNLVGLLLPSLAWIFVAFVVAGQVFRWEPRK